MRRKFACIRILNTIDGINLAFDVALVALDRDEVRNWPGVNR